MFSFLGISVGYAAIALYLYVAVAILRAEYTAGAGLLLTVTKAVLWPITIWSTIQKLYDTDPLT